jgi:protein-arginine kinase activator protein McsA
MPKGSEADIEDLKTKLTLYLHEEEYEKAEVMRKWIIDLEGDPSIENVESILKRYKK